MLDAATWPSGRVESKTRHLSSLLPSLGKGSGDDVFVVAKYDYAAQGSQELDLKKNEKLILLDDSKVCFRLRQAFVDAQKYWW